MILKKLLLLFFIIFLFNQNLNSLEITQIKAEGYFRGEHNRSAHFLSEVSAIGAVELENKYTFSGGLSIGITLIDTGINAFTKINYSPFLNLPLSFSVSYIYNGLLEYQTHTHSVFPLISYNADRAGISIGTNFRFSRFFGEKPQFESVFSFYGYFNFIKNDVLTLGIGLGNFNDFFAKNLGALSYYLNAEIQLNDNWQIINQIELMQSGMDGLSATFFGMAFRIGVKYTW